MRLWPIVVLLWACGPAEKVDTGQPGPPEDTHEAQDTAPNDTAQSTDTAPNKDKDTGPAQDTGHSKSDLAWPGEVWDEGTPEEFGYDAKGLEDARAYAFKSSFNTQSVVIIKDGVLIAEWYAEDTDQDTPVTTWSTAKSVMSALYGVALREKLLNLDDPVGAYMTEWSGEAYDAVTIRHLLEMQSGFGANESSYYGVYGSGDQLTYSLDRTPSWEPGQYFNYVNEDSMVLGGVLSQAFGREVGEVAQDEIFEPIGLEGAWWEDSQGASLTYCCIDSTARDMARFGLLFARNGEWDGNQIVPPDYVTESTTGISYYGYYGMQWWTYGEMFASVGANGQYIWIYPDQDLVVARFGTYWQVGDEKVRDAEWNNYHYTLDENGFQTDRFLDLIAAAALQ